MDFPVTILRPNCPAIFAAASSSAVGLDGSSDFMLMETGDRILVETGSAADVSDFAAATALAGTEIVAGVQSSATVQITIDQIKTYVNS